MNPESDTSPSPADVARQFVRARTHGVLSTMSQDVPGYPFGSVTPYTLTHEGVPVILVSDIAQHTKNMRADGHVSLTIINEHETDKQANARVTVIGDAREPEPAEMERLSARYYAFFPGHRSYFEAHNFYFFIVEPVRVRYIGGFGSIHWIEPEAWLQPTPKWLDNEAGAIQHMNVDHRESLSNMLRYQLNAEAVEPELIAIDREGFHVRGDDDRLHYLTFPSLCDADEDIHVQMVALAKEARAALAGSDEKV